MDATELLVSRSGPIGRIRLNRPQALNSLTLNMVRRFTHALRDFGDDPDILGVLVTGEGGRGLCAGGDIRGLYALRYGDKSPYRLFWQEEYQLDARIASFGKPYIALMDGLVMGGGVGISAHGAYRVVTERTRLAMPETGIGFIPDVGGTWLLSRAGGAGLAMALSGMTVSGADALHAGFADVAIDSRRYDELVARLQRIRVAEEIDAILRDMAIPLEAGELARNRAALDHAAAGAGLEEALARLHASDAPFARSVGADILRKSPTSVKATAALLQRASTARRLEDCLINEYRAACSLLESHDLYEGIRAAVIDKDRAPKWSPARLEDVSKSAIARLLAGDGSGEPTFATPP